MSDLLQRHLQLQAGTQNNLKLLESQWHFDKQLIPKVLQQVAQLFPHYSRHDQSHSEQILVNIERLLGPQRISMLSATDTWLLLESAYWHDIGMVVPNQALKDAIESQEFKNYKNSIANDITHELYHFARYFNGNDLTKVFSGADNPLDAVGKFRLLMAEWFRRQHPLRSEKLVNDPWNEIGLNSPRTELIPKRLFRILGRVCALHGASFDDVLAQLPHKEVGMSNDDCHPRFIACLLRLGDLLDMDDNRFCPVMQRIAGDRPALSLAHEDKHSSIRHFRLDSNRIEISAVCDSVDGYVEQWRWLDYLRDEMQCQMGRWQDIAPSAALGLLPTLGEVKVDISGRQLIAQPGKRPEFSLNSEKVMKLLRGENLYRKTDSIRELLQNSVDATLLRLWIESKIAGDPISKIPNIEAEKYFSKYPISITLQKEIFPRKDLLDDQIQWSFTLWDKGIGISQEDLSHIMSVGSSSQNSKKQSAISDMPEWFKPSGTFGIGLQSVFMWTDVILIETKNIKTQELLNISLHSPSGPKKGLITIELAENSYIREVGTKLSFTWITERRPKKFSISSKQKLTNNAYRAYDDLLDEDLPLDALNICDEINRFSEASLVEISFNLKISEKKSLSFSEKNSHKDFSSDFYPETNSKFNVSIDDNERNSIRFRGQLIDDAKLPAHYLVYYSIDLYSGGANAFLTFNRNGITSDGKFEIENIILRNLALWADKNYRNESLKSTISLLAKHWLYYDDVGVVGNKAIWEKISLELSDSWKDLTCTLWVGRKASENSTFRAALIAGNYIYLGHDSREIKFHSSGNSKVIFGYYKYLDIYIYCVKSWLENPNHGIQYSVAKVGKKLSDVKNCTYIKLISINKNESRLVVDRDALILRIENSIDGINKNVRLLIPTMLFPENCDLKKISLDDSLKSTRFRNVLPCIPYDEIENTILPFEIVASAIGSSAVKLDRLEEFLQFIHSKLKNPIEIAVIRQIYLKIIDYIDNDLMKDSSYWKEARKRANY